MHNLMRYIRQNKTQIIKVALIVAFLFGLLQLLNYLTKKDMKVSYEEKEDIYETSKGTIISDKSAVSGKQVSTNEIKQVSNKIEEFVKYCNEGKIEEAYNLLSDSCKEQFYTDIDSFKIYYFEPLFKDGDKTYTIENWIKDTYMVRFTGDLLATGKSSSDFSYQDYITIEEVKGEKKLNINKYIGKEEIKSTNNIQDIEITVLYKDKYMDYEEYEIKITNNTEGDILLDQLSNPDNIYLKDKNKTKHTAYSNEIIKDDLLIYKGHTRTLKIKFDNPYISNREIEELCFSNVILNYDINNKASADITKVSINI